MLGDRCIFDTNFIISIGQRYYPIDIFPSLWNQLEKLIDNGSILLTSGVQNEIKEKAGDPEDDENNWRDWWLNKNTSFQHENFQQEYGLLVNKLMKSPQYNGGNTGAKLRRFLAKADPWLIAIAKTEDLTLVSEEPNGNLKIPNICSLEGVECIDPLSFMRKFKIVL